MNYMKTFTLCLALMFGLLTYAQSDTTKRDVRGNRNTQVITSSRSNVPANQRNQQVASAYRPNPNDPNDRPDVLLDVPNLSIDTLVVEVDTLHADLALDARVANLVKLTAGVNVDIGHVNIRLKGVQATALLVVRLDNVRQIIDHTLTVLQENPQLVDRLLQTVDNTVGTVGNVANTALQPGGVISQTVNTLGQTVQKTIDATGNIIEKTLDTTGKVVNSKVIGKILDLPVVSQTTNAAGQTVKRVRDSSGQLLEVVLDKAGKVISYSTVSGN